MKWRMDAAGFRGRTERPDITGFSGRTERADAAGFPGGRTARILRIFRGAAAWRVTAKKALVTVVLCLWWIFGPVRGYGSGDMLGYVLYPLSHANVWHLLGNLFCLWCLRELHLAMAVAMAVACSFLPVWGFWDVGPTVGFSGVLFASVGVTWGRYCRRYPAGYRQFIRRVLPVVLLGAAIPHVNWCIHLYCVLMGFAYGRYR